MSNILPDQNFCHLFIKNVSKWHKKQMMMIHAFKGCITTKQGSGMWGDAPLLMNFVYEIDLSVAYLIYLCVYLFICYLFGYCG